MDNLLSKFRNEMIKLSEIEGEEDSFMRATLYITL